jgi:cytochrome c-type biogenesis protein CcmH
VTEFILAALAIALLAAAFVALPLLRRRADVAPAPVAAAMAVLVVILASALLYRRVASRDWPQLQSAQATASSIAGLARHLDRQPQDQAGWLELAAAYNGIGQNALALRSYERANRLSPGGNASALAGMGESILLSGDGSRADQAAELFERALRLDPHSAKALFYSGLIAFREGHLDVARSRFASILALSPPESVRAALQKQIDDIDAHAHPVLDPATAIHLHVTLAPALAARLPANASLFVFVRAPDGGPPLAVKRSDGTLPQDVELSAADSMVAERALKPGENVSVVARLSAAGSPLARSGDLYGQIDYLAGKSGARTLEIDRLSP